VIVLRKSIGIELYELGYTPDQVISAMHESGFINSALFEVWSKQVLFPDVEETRTRIGYDGDAHLLLDGCSCHSCDVFLDECTRRWIVLHLLPAYSSDQIQPLDLGIFGLQKSEAKRLRLPQSLNLQTVQVVKMLVGLQKATTRHDVVRAFRCAGICSAWSEPHQAFLVHVDRSAASHIRHWNCSKKRAVILREAAEVAHDPIEELDDPFRDEAQ
jgi:hypothetical protein